MASLLSPSPNVAIGKRKLTGTGGRTKFARGGVILALLMFFITTPAHAQDAPADTPPFGVIEAFWLPDAACELGAGWERIIFDWSQHQPESPEDWNTLNVDERWLRAAQDCDREVIAVVKNTPAWATDGMAGIGVPRGLDLPIDDPANLWGAFMRRAAEYYAPLGVRRFIIWNEPDIDAGTYGYEFGGTLEDYADLLRVAYHAARAGNPDARIHLAGVTYWHDIEQDRRLYTDRLLEYLANDPEAAAHGFYFDAITLHVYFQVETVYTITRAYRDLLANHGLDDTEIWVGETNASPNLDPNWLVERPNWQISLDQQAAFLVQGMALALAAGADHVGVYKLYDWNLPPGAESFGLIRVDETQRPAFDAWRFVIDHFSDVTAAERALTDRVYAVRLTHADGRASLIVWARTVQPALIRATELRAAVIYDVYGNIVNNEALASDQTFVLSGAVCNRVDGCPVGGLPLVITADAGANWFDLTDGGAQDSLPLSFE